MSDESSNVPRLDYKSFWQENQAVIFILSVTFAVYLNSLWNGFVWDDWEFLVPIEVYKNFDLHGIFFSKATTVSYFPVRDLTLAFDHWLWGGMEPFGFHLSNVIFYLLNIFVVFIATKRLVRMAGKPKPEFIAFWTTLIFALHPLHGEAVNFISARNNILAGLFIWLSLDFLLRWLEHDKPRNAVISCIFFFLVLFSKASTVFFPLAVTVLVWLLPSKPHFKKKWGLIAFFYLLDIFAIIIHIINARDTKIITNDFFRFGLENRLVSLSTALQIPFFYLYKFLFPYHLAANYPKEYFVPIILWRPILAFFVITISLFFAWKWRRKRMIISFAILWYYFSLGPVLNLIPVPTVIAERYAYLAVWGLALILAILLQNAVSKQKVFLYPAIIIIALWGGRDFLRNRDWRSDKTLWQAEIQSNPDVNRIGIAYALWKEEQYQKTLDILLEEKERNGSYNYDWYQGKYFMIQGKYLQATASLNKALAAGGDVGGDVNLDYAFVLEKSGKYLSAINQYLKVMQGEGVDPRGEIKGKAQRGIERIRKIFQPQLSQMENQARTRPGDYGVRANLALMHQQLGNYEQAIHYYREIVNLKKINWQVWHNMALAYHKQRKYQQSIEYFHKSLELHPKNLQAWNFIGISYRKLKKDKQAIEAFEQALAVNPRFHFAVFNLARIYFKNGDKKQARFYFEQVKQITAGNAGIQAHVDRYLQQLR